VTALCGIRRIVTREAADRDGFRQVCCIRRVAPGEAPGRDGFRRRSASSVANCRMRRPNATEWDGRRGGGWASSVANRRMR
jgi:hypothetical protein